MITEVFLWCVVAGGSFNQEPAIIDCYDSEQACMEDLELLECTKCYTHYNQTICPAFGVQVWD